MSSSSVVCQPQDCRTCIAYLSLLLHRTPCPQWLLISHSLNLSFSLSLDYASLFSILPHSYHLSCWFQILPISTQKEGTSPTHEDMESAEKRINFNFLVNPSRWKPFLRAWSRCPQDSWNNVSTHHMRLSWKELEGTGALRTAAQWCVSALDAVGFQDAKEKIKPPGYRQRVSIYLSERMSCLLPPARHGPWLSGVTSTQTSQGFGYCRV